MKLSKTIYVLILILFLALRLVGIKNDMTNSDAIRWHKRSEGFITALLDKDFAGTYQKYHPGVTLMWIVGGAKYIAGQTHLFQMGSRVSFDSKDWYPTVDGFSKTAVILVLFSLFCAQLLIISKLYGQQTSLVYGFMMAVEPYLIGIDRWLHLTSLEAYLVFTSFLLILYSKKAKYIVVSSILLGLAVLTKVTALILIPFFIYILWSEGKQKVMLFLSLTTITVFLLFPALWVIPAEVLSKVLKSGGEAFDGTLREENALVGYLFYPIMLFSKLGITTSILFFVSIINTIRIRDFKYVYIMAYIGTVLAGLTLAGQKIDRYIVDLIPIILLFIALNIRNWKMVVSTKILETALVIYLFFPVMSAYVNYLPNYPQMLTKNGYYDNSGEYFHEAASYLNTKKNALVFVPNNFDIFNVYYRGGYSKTLESADYTVLSLDVDRSEIFLPTCTKDKEFGPKTYKSVFIYKCNN